MYYMQYHLSELNANKPGRGVKDHVPVVKLFLSAFPTSYFLSLGVSLKATPAVKLFFVGKIFHIHII